ncbi:hypothetical protein [Micromonospora sp. NPDC092111]|uniref:hypothetical protein n=1 Tax=Micromonospora sp. NPDC092111 TaxID=3364289 RepID=UPI0038036B2B
MTGREFREVDHDLLADYVGGVLDGTPEQAVVARLVDAEPAWADAYAVLAPAVARVHADLAGWGDPAPEMPPAVVERLTAVLAGAGPGSPPPDDADQPSRLPGPVPAQPGGRRTPGARPDDGRADASGPGRRRRRWARLAAPVTLAAASLAAVGFGVAHLVNETNATDSATSTLAGPAHSGPGAPFLFAGEPQHSGVDWTPGTLNAATGAPLPQLGSSSLQPGNETGPQATESKRLMAPGGLDRLADRAALDACLAEIATAHGRGPVTVDVVDYAAFQGEPALVVRFADLSGERWAWVSGAECGVPGSGPDTRYQARVG